MADEVPSPTIPVLPWTGVEPAHRPAAHRQEVEGMDSTYASALAILRRMLSLERARIEAPRA
jgi:hypothetical protein